MTNQVRRAVLAFAALAVIVTAAGWTSYASARGSAPPPYARVLRPKLDALLKALLVPGAVVAVRSRELGDWSAGFGSGQLGAFQPLGVHNHFRIASNTKTMTGTVILQLVQEGKLRLDDPVLGYRPDVPNGENITIEQLLNMSSGLFNYTEAKEWQQTVDPTPLRVWAPEELLAIAFAHEPYPFRPGEGFHYSNTNTLLLGLIIEQLTGDPLDKAFEERIFKPLGLANTFLPKLSSAAIPQPHPQGYLFGTFANSQATGGVLPPDQQAAAKAGTLKPNDVTNTNPSFGWAAGGVISTGDDLARYVKALVGGGLLNRHLQQLRLDSLREVDPGYRYGYNIDSLGPLIGHGGDIPGFTSVMYHDPERQLTVVIFTTLNYSPDGTKGVVEVFRAVTTELYGRPVIPGPDNPDF
jgi:D-alanyl-D-alanine carboxypeptidase